MLLRSFLFFGSIAFNGCGVQNWRFEVELPLGVASLSLSHSFSLSSLIHFLDKFILSSNNRQGQKEKVNAAAVAVVAYASPIWWSKNVSACPFVCWCVCVYWVEWRMEQQQKKQLKGGTRQMSDVYVCDDRSMMNWCVCGGLPWISRRWRQCWWHE